MSLPRGTVRCYDYLRPSRLVRLLLPTGTLGRRFLFCVPPGLRRGWLECWLRRPTDARVLVLPVTHSPALTPKETGGSPEFPDYPFKSMPRSQTPVVTRLLALAQTGLLPSRHSIRSALSPVARTHSLTTIIHFSELNGTAWTLASPLLRTPCFQSRPSVRLLAWWLAFGQVGLESASHPLGNIDKFQELSAPFSHPGFISAREVSWLDRVIGILAERSRRGGHPSERHAQYWRRSRDP
jgi:hypothetical protein